MNDNEFNERMQFYRQRRARNISIAVMGYFVGVACIIGCSVFWFAPVAGVLLFLLCAAASTGLIIYTRMSTPLEFTGRYSDAYGYDCYENNCDNSNYDNGCSTREVSIETNGTENGTGAGADGAPGAGFNGGAGGAGGGKSAYRANSRYYTGRNVSPAVRMFRQIMEIYWLVVTIIYFALSFLTMRWDITWIIWLIGAAVDRAIRILWESRRYDDFVNKR